MTLTPEPGDITPQAPPSVHFPAPLSEANMPRGIVPTPLPTCTLEQLSLSPRKFREAIFELLRG